MTSKPRRVIRAVLRLVAAGFVLAAHASPAQNELPPVPTAAVDPAAAALAGFDETTGLWFPPEAPREVYLANSDPNHNLTRDMQKAFAANPALREAACSLATDPKREVRTSVLEPSVKQMRTRFQMLCAGAVAAEQNKKRGEKTWQENEARFERTRNAAHARALSDVERRERFLEIDAEFAQPAEFFARLDRGFEMLGLMPQAETAVFRLLAGFNSQSKQGVARFHDYLQRLFDRESAEGRPEAARYRMAMRNYLYLTNRLPEARAATRSVLEEESLSPWKTNNLAFLGLLDRLAGDVSALKRVASGCNPPEADATSYGDRPEGAYCFDLYFGLAFHDIEVNGKAAPAGLAGVLEEIISTEPANWPRRATAIGYVVRLDPARGRELAEELLQIPATITPLGARLDALNDLATASRKLHDFSRALAALDRYLDLLRYRPSPVPPGLWDVLTAVPEEERRPPSPIERIGWLNFSWALGEKAATSTEAGDFPGARRAMEAFLANALRLTHEIEKESGEERLAQLVDLRGLEAREREAIEKLLEQESEAVRRAARDQARQTRSYLGSYGTALVKAGRHEEAKRIAAYLIAQPGGERNLPTGLYSVVYEGRNPGEPLPTARSPWEASPDSGSVPPPRRR